MAGAPMHKASQNKVRTKAPTPQTIKSVRVASSGFNENRIRRRADSAPISVSKFRNKRRRQAIASSEKDDSTAIKTDQIQIGTHAIARRSKGQIYARNGMSIRPSNLSRVGHAEPPPTQSVSGRP